MELESLQRRIVAVETVLVLLTVGSIATADAIVGPQLSLGPLYLIPVSYSALVHRLRTTIGLIVVCVVLRQIFGPIENSADPMMAFLRDLGITAVFAAVVVFLRRFGSERREIFELARKQRDELAEEMDMAAVVQERLLALNEPPLGAFEISARTVPLHGVGGDYYDFIDLGKSRSALVVADIVGKGVPAALLMPALRFGIRSVVAGHGDPAERIGRLSYEFWQTTDPRNYGTLFYAQMELDTGRLTCVNAGHPAPVLVRADGSYRLLESGGLPIGLLEEGQWESEEVTLEPGDSLVVYTDGVTEAVNADGEELGTPRLAEFLARQRAATAEQLVAAVFDHVRAFLAAGPVDDATVIALRRPG